MLVFLILDTATLIGVLILNFTQLLMKFPTLFIFNILFVILSAILFIFSYLAFREVGKERDNQKQDNENLEKNMESLKARLEQKSDLISETLQRMTQQERTLLINFRHEFIDGFDGYILEKNDDKTALEYLALHGLIEKAHRRRYAPQGEYTQEYWRLTSLGNEIMLKLEKSEPK